MARAMKDSGIEWIGEIPEGWEISRNKNCFSCGKEIVGQASADTQLLSLTTKGVKKKSETDVAGKVPESYDTYQVVETNDLIMCLFDLDCSAVFSGLSPYNGMVSPAYKILKCNSSILPQYAQFWFSFIFDGRKFKSFAKNLRYTLNYDEFAVLPILLPNVAEQGKIVDFLIRECARIDAVIEQTRASIEEYKKLKQSVITQAVTKGIRPGRKMKDSGAEWIGVVPEEWAVTKLKYFSSIRSGITLGKTYSRDTKLVEYPYLRVANVQGSYTDLTDVATILVTEEEAEKYRLHDGELLMTEGGDRDKLGRGTVWHAEIDPCLHQNHVFALTTNDDLSAEYVSFLSSSLVGRDYFDVTANQSVHLASTNSTTIMNFTIPVPSIEEQNEIVSYLTVKSADLEKLIAKKQALIFALESYKKTMIFEYVTGKKEAW